MFMHQDKCGAFDQVKADSDSANKDSRKMTNTNKTSFTLKNLLRFTLISLALSLGLNAHAALTDFSEDQQADYRTIAEALSVVNNAPYTAETISDQTYWVDAANGIDDFSRTGQIDQPWKSIVWAINNIPYEKQTANIVVRSGVYAPVVLYIGEERGGDASAASPFNLIAFPNETVMLDGANVADNGALISVAGAAHVTISGFELSNISGTGKSAIYINNASLIKISGNEIRNSQWTTSAEDAAYPTLSDRFNGIAVVGESFDITIENNNLHDLVTGYGEPILVVEPALASLSGNILSDNDADVFDNQQYYVSSDGDDEAGVGSLEKPWKTIHKALFSIPYAEDNATVNIRAGTYQIPTALYFEALRGGSEGKYFTVQAYSNEAVVIDGGLLDQPFSAMVSFSSAAYVRIKGLTFTNLYGPKSAIYMEGSSHHIELIENTLHGMSWADDASEDESNPQPSDNLNPIAVIGNNAELAMHNIVIRGNELYDIVPGYSEGIKIVGNVTDFLVEQNTIHNIANIGIVAAGNYTWVVDAAGIRIPDEVNHARDGIIRKNTVSYAVSPVANSAGIYLDGAHNVLVEHNISHHNSVGFSVGCEQPGTSENNTVRYNVAYQNDDAGLVVGTIHASASVSNTTVEFNEFKQNYQNGEWGGELTIQQTDGLTIQNNLFVSRSDLMLIAAQAATNLTIDNNLYFGASANADSAIFDWGGITGTSYIGLTNFQEATCYDLNSLYQDADSISYLEALVEQTATSDTDASSQHRAHGHKKHSKSKQYRGKGKKTGHHKKATAVTSVCSAGSQTEDNAESNGHKPKHSGSRKQSRHRSQQHSSNTN